ncbi:MAG: hypothetical protein C0404_02405 [Verrucomicrobia bacterium]|nr:hypothetical protein [Verrucomicrobiota bacterium]
MNKYPFVIAAVLILLWVILQLWLSYASPLSTRSERMICQKCGAEREITRRPDGFLQMLWISRNLESGGKATCSHAWREPMWEEGWHESRMDRGPVCTALLILSVASLAGGAIACGYGAFSRLARKM